MLKTRCVELPDYVKTGNLKTTENSMVEYARKQLGRAKVRKYPSIPGEGTLTMAAC